MGRGRDDRRRFDSIAAGNRFIGGGGAKQGGSHGLPSLRLSTASGMGACQRIASLPLRRLPARFQRADGDPLGPSASEGEMGGADGGSDNRRKPGQSGGTLRRRRHHRVPLAPPVSLGAGARQAGQLTGIVEADETFVLESFKGKRAALPRPARKRGGKASKRGLPAEQIPVLVARDRTGQTTGAVLAKLDRASVTAALEGVVTPENQLCRDGGKAIVSFARKAKIPCCILPKPGGPRPEAPNLHINNVNGVTTAD